jgi:hypothetical protein
MSTLQAMPDKWEQSNEVTEPDYKALYTELLAKHEKPCDPQRLCCHNATQKLKGQLGESEAKYETLLQGVKDAKAEIVANEMHYATIHMQDDIERGMELAYERSAEILTDKTNVL